MRIRSTTAQVALLVLFTAAQVHAQKVVDLSADVLDRFLKGADAEQVEMGKSGDQMKELDDKIKKFRECKNAFEIAAGGGGKLGMGAKIAMRAKCGASDEDGFQKERQKLAEGPVNAGAKAAGMKTNDYSSLKDRITGYMNGDRSGFTPAGLDVLKAREADLSKSLGMAVTQMGGGGNMSAMSSGGRRGAHMPGAWSTDYAWQYIGELFAMQYASGAAMFEEPYKPGEWTQWKITDTGNPDEPQTIERAFLAKTPEGSEWWRLKTTSAYKDGDKTLADTVIIEALYKPTSEYTKELVRVRAKLPGNKDAQELLVPAGMGMINYNGMFPMRPTKESIDGATVGTEKITTTGGSFTARHVRFAGGNGGGTLDWWLTSEAPGGWVKFTGASNSGGDKDLYTIELTGKGTGAKSELGVIK